MAEVVAAGRAAGYGSWEVVQEFGEYSYESVAVDSHGNVYAVDGKTLAEVFTADGVFLREMVDIDEPSGIAIDEQDVVYVVHNNWTPPRCTYVARYNTNLQFLGGWPSCLGEGDLQTGRSVDVQSGVAWVTTTSSLLEFTTDGTFLEARRTGGWQDVAFANDGSLWAVSTVDYRGLVRHYAPDGSVIIQYETILSDEDHSHPISIDVDSRQRAFVVDVDNNRVKIFNSGGFLEDLIEANNYGYVMGIALDGDETFYLGSYVGILKFQHKPLAVEAATWGGIKAHFQY